MEYLFTGVLMPVLLLVTVLTIVTAAVTYLICSYKGGDWRTWADFVLDNLMLRTYFVALIWGAAWWLAITEAENYVIAFFAAFDLGAGYGWNYNLHRRGKRFPHIYTACYFFVLLATTCISSWYATTYSATLNRTSNDYIGFIILWAALAFISFWFAKQFYSLVIKTKNMISAWHNAYEGSVRKLEKEKEDHDDKAKRIAFEKATRASLEGIRQNATYLYAEGKILQHKIGDPSYASKNLRKRVELLGKRLSDDNLANVNIAYRTLDELWAENSPSIPFFLVDRILIAHEIFKDRKLAAESEKEIVMEQVERICMDLFLEEDRGVIDSHTANDLVLREYHRRFGNIASGTNNNKRVSIKW